MRGIHRILILMLMMLTNMGCSIELPGWLTIAHDDGNNGNNENHGNLPAPETPRGEFIGLTTEQQRKKDEADAYIRDVLYQGRPIEKTVQGYSGLIYDYMKIQPLGIDVPDVASLLPGAPADGIQLGLTEVEKYPELWGPLGTTVFARPDFSKYIMENTGATSVQDWVANYQVPGLPGEDPNRLYAGLNIPAPNHGIFARVNMFRPEVAQNSMSVIQLAVSCPAVGEHAEFIGVLLSVDRINTNADQLTSGTAPVRLHVEFRKMTNGKLTGSFDEGGGHFTAEATRLTGVGAVVEHVSVAGGQQWEHALLLIRALNGDWVVFYNGQNLGKYEAHHFNTLQNGACRAHVYGEVYNPTPEQGWIATEMGSGQFSGTPQGRVAWMRQIRYLDTNYFPQEPPTDAVTSWSKPYHYPCYDRQPLTYQDGAGPTLTFGGPGGKEPVCAQKKPQ